jgi:hypothetical protein
MNNSDIEELIYEYGHVMYRIGRMETDGNTSTKEYNKFCDMRDKLKKQFDEHFNSTDKYQNLKKVMGVSFV